MTHQFLSAQHLPLLRLECHSWYNIYQNNSSACPASVTQRILWVSRFYSNLFKFCRTHNRSWGHLVNHHCFRAGRNSVMLLWTVQNAESGTILYENDDWNLFHISTWVEQSMHTLPRKCHRDIRHITCMTCIFRDVFLLFIFYAQVDHRTSVQLWAFWSTFYRNLQKDNNKKNGQL